MRSASLRLAWIRFFVDLNEFGFVVTEAVVSLGADGLVTFELLEPTAKIFQFVIRAAREVSGFAPLRNGFIHHSRRSETVANNDDFGETKADFDVCC